jgi:small GTP-binding protein
MIHQHQPAPALVTGDERLDLDATVPPTTTHSDSLSKENIQRIVDFRRTGEKSPMRVVVYKHKHTEEMDVVFKFVCMGMSGVGKSTMCNTFSVNEYTMKMQQQATIGVDFSTRQMKIGDTTVQVQLWDTAGQELFKSTQPSYYRKTSGMLLMYDVTDPASYNSLPTLLEDIAPNLDEGVEVTIIASKTDLTQHRVLDWDAGVRMRERLALAHPKLNISYTETSGFDPNSVYLAFIKTAWKCLGLYTERAARLGAQRKTGGLDTLPVSLFDSKQASYPGPGSGGGQGGAMGQYPQLGGCRC